VQSGRLLFKVTAQQVISRGVFNWQTYDTPGQVKGHRGGFHCNTVICN